MISHAGGTVLSKLSFENIYITLDLVVWLLFHFSSMYEKCIGILFILYIWWSHCKSLATFTFGADIPSLGDFSGHIVILGKIRKIYFENFWVSLRSIFFHLVWIELIWEWQTGNLLERTTSTKPLRNNVYAFPTHTKWDFPPECCKSSRKDSLSLFLEFYPCFLENNALK